MTGGLDCALDAMSCYTSHEEWSKSAAKSSRTNASIIGTTSRARTSPRGRYRAMVVGFGRCKACCGRTERASEGRDTARCPRHLAVKLDDEFSHAPPRPSGRPTRVSYQDAVLGLWWSVLDAAKLVAGVLNVPMKVVILQGVRGILP